MTKSPRLERGFYQQDPVRLARALLGQRVVRVLAGQRLAGRIVETEAYLGANDRAAHTFGNRRTPRNESMWGEAGLLYVYFTYGMHYCMNVVAGGLDQPVAVLLRALEPEEGVEQMRQHRPQAKRDRELCAGPARLCQALAINRTQDGLDLVTDNAMWLERTRARTLPASQIVVTPRVGIAYAGDWAQRPLRFYVRGNACVSRP